MGGHWNEQGFHFVIHQKKKRFSFCHSEPHVLSSIIYYHITLVFCTFAVLLISTLWNYGLAKKGLRYRCFGDTKINDIRPKHIAGNTEIV